MKKLLIAFLVLTAVAASAQNQPVNLSNSPERRAHGFTEENEDLPARNHGMGVRLGSAWAVARSAVDRQRLPVTFEAGFFHQRALSRAVSVQGEALYYRDFTTTGRSSGLRLPALLVINPFYNVSLHAGPQLQWRAAGTAPRAASLTAETVVPVVAAAPRLTGGLVVGGEARAGFLRVGVRYALPFNDLLDLQAAGQQVGRAWHNGQVQAYLGVGFAK